MFREKLCLFAQPSIHRKQLFAVVIQQYASINLAKRVSNGNIGTILPEGIDYLILTKMPRAKVLALSFN